MVQYIIVGLLGFLSVISMCMFLFVKEGTKGLKAKPYKTKSGIRPNHVDPAARHGPRHRTRSRPRPDVPDEPPGHEHE